MNNGDNYLKSLLKHRALCESFFIVVCCFLFYFIISGLISFSFFNEDVNYIIKVTVIILGTLFYGYHFVTSLKYFKYPIICKVDYIALYNIVGIITFKLCFWMHYYKFPVRLVILSNYLYIMAILEIISVAFWIFRIIVFSNKKHEVEIVNNTITLKDLYNNNINNDNRKFFTVDNNPTIDDIFKREYFRDQLIEILDNNGSNNSLVIGVNGEWGSGKTSILNAVHAKLDDNKYEWIDFNPWGYENFTELIEALYTDIISHTPFKHSFVSKRYLRYVKAVFTQIDSSITKCLSVFISDKTNFKSLQADINEILRYSNKRFVIIIDDFDRLLKEAQISIMPLLHNFFGFCNCTYVLSYERAHIVANYEDPKFIDKVINYEVRIPQISFNQRQNIIKRCLINTLQYYLGGISIDDYNDAIDYACNKIQNIRDLVLLINSLKVLQHCKNSGLYMPELVGIIFLKSLNLELYTIVESNRNYFITSSMYSKPIYDKMYYRPYTYVNKILGQELFDSIFKNEIPALNLLATMFPYVNEYKINSDYPDAENMCSSNDTDILCRIDNILYFNAYFEVFDSVYLGVKNKIKELREYLTDISISSLDDYVEKFKRYIKKFDPVLFFKRWKLQENVSDIEKLAFIVAMMDFIGDYEYIDDIEAESLDFVWEYRSYILRNIIIFHERQIADYFIKRCFTPKNIKFINHFKSKSINDIECPKYMANEFSKLKDKIMYNKIDLFDNQFYRPRTLSTVIDTGSDKTVNHVCFHLINDDNNKWWKEYFDTVVQKEKHLYKVVLEAIWLCIDGLVSKDEVIKFFGDIDTMLDNNPPKTKLEKQIYDKWNNLDKY